ncbi:hypothetical protein [uncultured Alistipes sp.]|uniref:hypothetical protein n=1 Tax=uncultured Alistipes sp. TaxID=538949 RepID=UPI0026290C4C|nr:hypothetical protein [uncultured Alistipes sp.]
MKRLIAYLFLTAALLAAGGCGDDSEVFYSIAYPVVRIEAEVTLPEPEEPEEPSTGEDSGSEGTDGTDGTDDSGSTDGTVDSGTTDGTEEPVDPLVAQIQAEVLAEAPVQAGGSYALDFTRYNRGPLTVDTAAEAGTVPGAFFKEPGATEIRFLFLELDYTAALSSYTDTDGVRRVLLTVDLTKEFQKRYPETDITKIVRREYTSTPAN